MQSIVDLLTSRKAIVMMLAIVAVSTLAGLGKIEGTQALDFCKWIVSVWLGAQAAVDIATKPKLSAPSIPPPKA